MALALRQSHFYFQGTCKLENFSNLRTIMYSEKTVLRNLDEFAAREGWCPQYHTYDEVREFSAYIDSLTKIESNTKSSYISVIKPITSQRQKAIARWIENEQVLCGFDSSY